MKYYGKKILSFILTVSLIWMAMPTQRTVHAEDLISITSENYGNGSFYTWDSTGGIYVYAAPSGGEFSKVYIPQDYHFVVDSNVTINELTIKDGGFLEIVGGGRLTVTTMSKEPGANMLLGSKDNVPAGISVHDITSGDVDITSDSEWHDMCFSYSSDGAFTGWGWIAGAGDPGNSYEVILDGYAWDGSVTVSYSFDGSSFVPVYENGNASGIGEIIQDEGNHNVGIRLDISEFVDEGASPQKNPDDLVIKVKITSGNKIIALADFGEENDASTYISGDKDSFEYAMSSGQQHFIGLALSYPNEGLKDIEEEVKNYLFAYNTVDATNLATELYDRFIQVPMYERFGFTCLEGDAGYNAAKRTTNITELASRITIPGSRSATVNVIEKNGSSTSRDVYDCTVDWGYDRETGDLIQSVIPVIDLSSANEFITCINWNPETGFGASGSFYSRINGTDAVQFFTDDGADCYSITVPESLENRIIVAGGSGGRMTELNTDGMYSFRFDVEGSYNATVRVLKETERYIAVQRGGSDKVGGLGYNGTGTDDIWNTGDDGDKKELVAYVGDSDLYFEPLDASATGLSGTATITGVRLKDLSMADGVEIDTSTLSKIKISFKSNFYDSVPLIITYSGGTEKEITITRIGLVIQYIYLADEETQPAQHTITYDGKSQSCTVDYNYWNNSGVNKTANEQVLIYATYYHPSNDNTTGNSNDLSLSITYDSGETEIISHTDAAHNFNGYTVAGSDCVATTSFLIGFAPAKQKSGYDWIDITSQTFSKGGLSATVLNAGYDNATTFGGTQVGSGSGVYWDGRIEWF